MGNITSNNIITPVNYNCPRCSKNKNKNENKNENLNNIVGKFFIINNDQCQCKKINSKK